MTNLKPNLVVKINNGLVKLPDNLSKLTSQSFVKMICNPDLRFKFALRHNLDICALDDDRLFASKFVNNYDSWLKYSKSSKNLIISVLTQHPKSENSAIFDDFYTLVNHSISMFPDVPGNYRHCSTSYFLQEILSNQFTIDFLNFITSSSNYSIEKITPFIFKNILFFCLVFQTIVHKDSWIEFKSPLENGNSKEKFTYKSIMSSFLHAQQNWFLYFHNLETISTVFSNLSYDQSQEASDLFKDFTLLFLYLNIISYIKHVQCMPEESNYLRIKSFITSVEYMNSKVKDTLGPSGFSPFFTFECESENCEYKDTFLSCNVTRSDFDEFKGHVNRIFNPIYSSLNDSCFSFIDSSVYTSAQLEYTSSFRRSCRDTYVYGFFPSNQFHRNVVNKCKNPLFSSAFTDSHFGLKRHEIASAIFNQESKAIFGHRIQSEITRTCDAQVNTKLQSYFANMFQLYSVNSFSFFDLRPINIQDFSPFFNSKFSGLLAKPISDAPVAPLNWLNNNNSVFLANSSVLKQNNSLRCIRLDVNDTYNHSSATENGIKMNNCIDRFTLPVSSGITEVIIFHARSCFLTQDNKKILAKLIDKYNLSSSIDLFISAMELTSQSVIAYEGGIRDSDYSKKSSYKYHQFNAYSNYNYTLDTYVITGNFVAEAFPFYAIISTYLLSIPFEEAESLLESTDGRLDEIANRINLLLKAQKGELINKSETQDIEEILDALEIISTISEASLLENYYQDYVTHSKPNTSALDKDSIIDTLDFVSIDCNSIYLNPSKAPGLYSYTDFFRTSDFRKTLEVEDTIIPVSISISAMENIPVPVTINAINNQANDQNDRELIPF